MAENTIDLSRLDRLGPLAKGAHGPNSLACVMALALINRMIEAAP